MRTLAWTGLMALLTCLTTGCVIENVDHEGLPRGATLVDSDRAACDGTVEIEGYRDMAVNEGESKTIAVRDQRAMDWECLSDSPLRKGGDIDCPSGTDYVRILRDNDDDDFTIECYDS